jgi:hypothetical protein
MLLEIRDYMQQHKTANLKHIAAHLKQDELATRLMLEHWLRKGKLIKLPPPPGCGSRCQQCQPEFAEVYRWID